jgi:low affinity Fe/Cu permease
VLDRAFTWVASKIAFATGQPLAFIIALFLIAVWGLTGPVFHYSDTWQLVVNTATTIITFLMVFLIQNSQNRDAAAMQAKLDELIRSIDDARGQFIGIEHKSEREIEKIRSDLEQECQDEQEVAAGKPKSEEYVGRLIRRR